MRGVMLTLSAYQDVPGSCGPTALHEVADADWSSEDVMEVAKANDFPYAASGGWQVPGIERGMDDLMIEWERTRYGAIEAENGAVIGWQRGPRAQRPTIAQFARAHPTGTHLLIVTGHACVLREGQIVDPNWHGRRATRRRVWVSYEIKNPGPGRYAPASKG